MGSEECRSRLDGVGGKTGGQARGTGSDAVTGKKSAELVDRTAHAFLSGVVRCAEELADLAQAFVFEIAGKERAARR